MNDLELQRETAWHTLEADDTLAQLQTDLHGGLASSEAQQRLQRFGSNELIDRGGISRWQILWGQLTSIMVIILIVASIVAAFLGDIEDTIVILALVIINTFIGYTQEYRAEQSMAALKQLSVPTVRVRRDGALLEIPAPQLVPGDIVVVEAGNRIAADGRLLESAALQVQEAALTGESVPVSKAAMTLAQTELALGDRHNMLYMGTEITTGRGVFVVTATGMHTELGKIADLIQTVQEEQTPLQRRLDELGRLLAILAIIIVVIVFILGLVRGDPLELMLLTSISLAVAAVPEGLPATVTIALSLGAQRMLQRNALIRKLPAVETLGSVTTICSDKTGTLTENRMTVTVLAIGGTKLELQGEKALPIPDLQDKPALAFLLAGAALCNDAEPRFAEAEKADDILGDPTEVALVVASNRQGMHKSDLDALFPRVAEAPFDSKRKRMTTLHRRPDAAFARANGQIAGLLAGLNNLGDSSYFASCKGAVDGLLDISTHAWLENSVVPVDEPLRRRILTANAAMAANGLRVLGVAYRLLDELPPGAEEGDGAELEKELVLVGMVGMIDPARPEVRDAVQTCKEAGIRVKMITGDHPATALAIARQLGIAAEDDQATIGLELNKMEEQDLRDIVHDVPVFARVAPEHKLHIVQALQANGEVVAMTGDGVNDAPALKQAEIGVAMGIAGTDVTKEAADMVLQDDNFATIVAAVSEGRVVYANIRKFIRYLLTGNIAEIMVMLVTPFLGMPLALLPMQILWINLLTDGLPALALGVEPAENNVMRQPPRSPTESILGRGMGWLIAIAGSFLAVLSVGVGYWAWSNNNPDWQTMVFTTLTFGQMAAVLTLRSGSESFFRFGIVRNPALIGAVALTVVLQLAVTYVPFLQQLFKTTPLTLNDLLICVGLGFIMLLGVEVEKAFTEHRE